MEIVDRMISLKESVISEKKILSKDDIYPSLY